MVSEWLMFLRTLILLGFWLDFPSVVEVRDGRMSV